MKLTKNERILAAAEAMDLIVREKRITDTTEANTLAQSVLSSRYRAEALVLRERIEHLCCILDPEGAEQVLGRTVVS